MSERQQRFRLGLFVLISLGLLASLIVVFGGAPDWFARRNQYTILFSDAPGISPGTPVRKSGVKVGEVHAIELDDVTGQVRVVVRLDPKFTPRTSDEPTVTRGLIVGDTAIDFIPKSTDKPQRGDPIPPGSTIQGVAPFNAKMLLDQTVGVIPEAQKSLEQVRKSLQAIEKLSPQFETTLKEFTALARSGREFIPELKRTNDSLRDFIAGDEVSGIKAELKKTNDEVRFFLKTASFWIEEAGVMLKSNEPRFAKAIDSLTKTSDSVGQVFNEENRKSIAETLKNIREASGRLERTMLAAEDLMKDGKSAMKTFSATMSQAEQAIGEFRQATKPLADKAGKILDNIDQGSDQFNKAMVDVRELVKAIVRSEGTFQKIVTDPSLYNNLNDTTAAIAKLVPRMDRILKDLEVFADKIARHPEALGIGGAIRPNSGLKESPSTPVFKPRMP